MPEDLDLSALRLLNAELKERLARQDTAASQVDTKAALVGALALASAQFMASQDRLNIAFATGALVSLAGSAGLAVATYALSGVKDVPDPQTAITLLATASETEVLAQLIGNRAAAFEKNKERSERKIKFWWASLAGLLLGVFLAIGAVLHTG